MKRVIATPPGAEPIEVDLTTEEIAERQQKVSDARASIQANQWSVDRQIAYAAKGWSDPFSLIEDVLARGINVVRSERAAIKAQYPKSV